MKTLVISLCLFLFLGLTTAENNVVDVDGEPLKQGVEYYARYFIWPGGGPSLASVGNRACPLSVVRLGWTDPNSDGLPITITARDTDDIVENSPVFIEFRDADTSQCPYDSTIWRVLRDSSINRTAITVGGLIGSDQSEFSIQKSGFAYKFLFHGNRFITQYWQPEDQGIRLVLNEEEDEFPYQVVFFKKSSLTAVHHQHPK